MTHSFSKTTANQIMSISTFSRSFLEEMSKKCLEKRGFFQEYFEMICCVRSGWGCRESCVVHIVSKFAPSPLAHSNIFARAKHKHMTATVDDRNLGALYGNVP